MNALSGHRPGSPRTGHRAPPPRMHQTSCDRRWPPIRRTTILRTTILHSALSHSGDRGANARPGGEQCSGRQGLWRATALHGRWPGGRAQRHLTSIRRRRPEVRQLLGGPGGTGRCRPVIGWLAWATPPPFLEGNWIMPQSFGAVQARLPAEPHQLYRSSRPPAFAQVERHFHKSPTVGLEGR